MHVAPHEPTRWTDRLAFDIALRLEGSGEDGFVDGYAQVVTSDELSDLTQLDSEELLGDRDPIGPRSSISYARKDDDSGNSSEY